MSSPNGQPLGVSRTIEKPTAIDSAHRQVQPAHSGKTMLELASDQLEEAGSYLHKYRNLNRSRAKESRKDFDSSEIKKLTNAALNQHQVGKITELAGGIKQGRYNKSEILDQIRQFSQQFSSDSTQRALALLSLKSQIADAPEPVQNLSEINSEIDAELEPISNSLEFKAGILAYSASDLAEQGGLDKYQLQQATQPSYAVDFGNIYQVVCDLREKFGERYLALGAAELCKQLSAQYHEGGRNIDSSELISLMRNMSELKVLLALFDACGDTARLLVTPATDLNKKNELTSNLLSEVLSLQKKNWVESSDITQIATKLEVSDLAQMNILAVQIKHIVGLVPDHIYGDPMQKRQCIDAIFKCTDMFAKRESASA
ncbi:TyeA family type III secretion system gatekeeper subunit [Microbulbifer sp. JMSA003]|uniref:TyeA family type III secretion system gatekeeper subunit n=1 Tax=Microbulbifer sp. JMSA003 TaxID=3243369 RepID=UPI004039D782